jgi:MFS family permease
MKSSTTFLVVDPDDGKSKDSTVSTLFIPSRALASAVRKIDLRVLSLLLSGYLFCMLDRANIGYARVSNYPENLDHSLGLEDSQGGLAISIFFATYVLFELPSNMLMKVCGRPSKWLAFLVVGWGVATFCIGFVNSYSGLLTMRLVLGVFESGYFPGGLFFLVSSLI